MQTKEPSHKDDFDEWLARIICYAFSVPPQWATKVMNRATADNQSEQAEDEGLEPTKEWVKDLIDEIIAEEFASPDLELAWLDEDEADPKGLEAVLEGRVKLGAVTLNEMRDALGLDPYTNPAADRAMVLTATGYVPIEANASGAADADGESGNANGESRLSVQKFASGRLSAISEEMQAPALDKYGYNPEEPRIPKHHTGGGEWTHVAGSDDPNEASDAPNPGIPYQKYGKGHHWVPKEIYENRDFSKETKAIFKGSTSGPLADPSVNFRTSEHIQYTEAVDELLDDFLKKNNITEEEMTPAQAEEFVQEVIGSSDPRISAFVTNIKREMWRYIEHYGPWRRGGGGDED